MTGFFTKQEIQSSQRPDGKSLTCYSCGLYKHATHPKMEPYGNFKKGIMNIGEALSFTGASNIVCAAADLSDMGPRVVIVKKGEHGAYMLFDSRQFALPAYQMGKVVDPTGAGDSFAGGFMGYLANCRKINFTNLKRAMVYGTLMASFNVESFSVIRLKNLKKSEIRSRYIDYLKIFSV